MYFYALINNFGFKCHDRSRVNMHHNFRRTFHDKSTLSSVRKVEKYLGGKPKKGKYMSRSRNVQG